MSAVHVQVATAGETYAIPVDRAREVVELGAPAPVPGAPPPVLGIRNLRGHVFPVVDLAAALGLGPTQPRRVLVVEYAGTPVGLAVDEVAGIRELPEPEPAGGGGMLSGAAFADGELVGILDLDRLLDGLAQPDR